ncbi:toxin-antitoxin system antitoxin subunit [Faecalimonas sp.]
MISRPKNENVVIISESEYKEIIKAKKNADYMAMLDKSILEAENGGFIAKSLEELDDFK